MNDLKKKGTIKTYEDGHGSEVECIVFELIPCLRNEGSPTVSRHSWTRFLGMPKTFGKG
jgi:hypothetical protein